MLQIIGKDVERSGQNLTARNACQDSLLSTQALYLFSIRHVMQVTHIEWHSLVCSKHRSNVRTM
jgi:hypothetical protein